MADLLSAIQEVLLTEDPEGLLELGAPADEYTHEARQIASELDNYDVENLTEENVEKVIRAVWIRSFGPFSEVDIGKRSPAFRQVAHRILSTYP